MKSTARFVTGVCCMVVPDSMPPGATRFGIFSDCGAPSASILLMPMRTSVACALVFVLRSLPPNVLVAVDRVLGLGLLVVPGLSSPGAWAKCLHCVDGFVSREGSRSRSLGGSSVLRWRDDESRTSRGEGGVNQCCNDEMDGVLCWSPRVHTSDGTANKADYGPAVTKLAHSHQRSRPRVRLRSHPVLVRASYAFGHPGQARCAWIFLRHP